MYGLVPVESGLGLLSVVRIDHELSCMNGSVRYLRHCRRLLSGDRD